MGVSRTAREAMRILLLNPPGSRRYLRDYYCAGIAKSRYSYPPMDLVYLSGLLAPFGQCRFVDAIAAELPEAAVRETIEEWSPDLIVSLVSGLSLREDLAFLERVKRPGRRIVATGDVTRDAGEALLGVVPFLDGALEDFTESGIAEWLAGESSPTGFPGLAVRLTDGTVRPAGRGQTGREFSMPTPHWEVIPLHIYRFPFVRRRRFASLLTDFGCPFSCTFCPMGAIRWKVRPLTEVREEIDGLMARGIREIHFRDQTFGLPPERLDALLEMMEGRDVSWSCFSRLDVIRTDTLPRMKHAGCHTIIFGIESAGEARRNAFDKGLGDDLVQETLRACRRCGIRTVGTFIIGLPGETEESVKETVRYACSLPLDFASFNIGLPRFGIRLRHEAEQGRGDSRGIRTLDDLLAAAGDRCGFAPTAWSTRWARYANRRFYLHPRTLWRQASTVRSPAEFLHRARIGIGLLTGG